MFHTALIACESAWLPRWVTSLQSFLVQTAALHSVSSTLLHFLHSRLNFRCGLPRTGEAFVSPRGQNFNYESANQNKTTTSQSKITFRWMGGIFSGSMWERKQNRCSLLIISQCWLVFILLAVPPDKRNLDVLNNHWWISYISLIYL